MNFILAWIVSNMKMTSMIITNMNNLLSKHPYFTEGKVVKGFGRGSKSLGIPTANFPNDVVEKLPKEFETGVYYGWARINNDEIHRMSLSIGYNPFFNNEFKTIETHILHEFEEDFYDSWLRILITGYIRPMENYPSLEDLIAAINNDNSIAKESSQKSDQSVLKEWEALTQTVSLC